MYFVQPMVSSTSQIFSFCLPQIFKCPARSSSALFKNEFAFLLNDGNYLFHIPDFFQSCMRFAYCDQNLLNMAVSSAYSASTILTLRVYYVNSKKVLFAAIRFGSPLA